MVICISPERSIYFIFNVLFFMKWKNENQKIRKKFVRSTSIDFSIARCGNFSEAGIWFNCFLASLGSRYSISMTIPNHFSARMVLCYLFLAIIRFALEIHHCGGYDYDDCLKNFSSLKDLFVKMHQYKYKYCPL